jgi:hypothetical protein
MVAGFLWDESGRIKKSGENTDTVKWKHCQGVFLTENRKLKTETH